MYCLYICKYYCVYTKISSIHSAQRYTYKNVKTCDMISYFIHTELNLSFTLLCVRFSSLKSGLIYCIFHLEHFRLLKGLYHVINKLHLDPVLYPKNAMNMASKKLTRYLRKVGLCDPLRKLTFSPSYM